MTKYSDETLSDQVQDASANAADLLAAPHLFLVMHCDRPHLGAARFCLLNLDEVVIGRGAARSSRRSWSEGVRRLVIEVPDARVSAQHARLVRRDTSWVLEDCGSRNGTRVDSQPVTHQELEDGALIEVGHTFFAFRSGLMTHPRAMGDLDSGQLGVDTPTFSTVIPALGQAFEDLGRVARSTLSVLLLGESGSGKELLARAIHQLSRRTGPFVAINCGAIPAALIESQLFGHVKGAFSGATSDAQGLVRAAHGGTLFLDEIGDLPLDAQAVLLRVLEEHEVVPVGATRPISVDLRVVAATHARIDKRVEDGGFRNDLFARLSSYRFLVPALRDRAHDMAIFVSALLSEGSKPDSTPQLTPHAARALFRYDWPRNIRELKHCILTALVLSDGGPIQEAHIEQALVGCAAAAGPEPDRRPDRAEDRVVEDSGIPDAQLREELQRHFAECDGNLSEVARRMGKARMQIHRWTKRLVIDPRKYRRSLAP